jgi:hypothetical protein
MKWRQASSPASLRLKHILHHGSRHAVRRFIQRLHLAVAAGGGRKTGGGESVRAWLALHAGELRGSFTRAYHAIKVPAGVSVRVQVGWLLPRQLRCAGQRSGSAAPPEPPAQSPQILLGLLQVLGSRDGHSALHSVARGSVRSHDLWAVPAGGWPDMQEMGAREQHEPRQRHKLQPSHLAHAPVDGNLGQRLATPRRNLPHHQQQRLQPGQHLPAPGGRHRQQAPVAEQVGVTLGKARAAVESQGTCLNTRPRGPLGRLAGSSIVYLPVSMPARRYGDSITDSTTQACCRYPICATQ